MRQLEEQRAWKRAYVKRMKRIRILFWCVSVCLFFSSTSLIFAKYYAKESRKGVATASGLYFTSNYLQTFSGEDLPERANTNQWLGSGTCTIGIEVYNYSNILLYNDENLNITYDMHFQLQEEPEENESYKIAYTVEENGEQVEKIIELSDTTQKTITGMYLPGGQATSNYVELQITPNKNNESEKVDNSYRSKRVAVWVEPTAPDYVAKSNKLGAILSATPSKLAFSMDAVFDISEKMESLDEEGIKTLLRSYAGFVYKIQTSGELSEQQENKKIKLTWNSTYLEMDIYNKYYKEFLQNGLVTEETGTDGAVYKSMKMDMVSYISMEFNFYKTSEFEEKEWTKESFKALVQTEIVDAQ